ncbi:MAG: YbaB/EbfC family nucleoid-associated protein [Mycolicibacterium insubricum]|uniref:DNA-binding protein n=1 Tax=Mycolicibacterium insubricum TaxID=444597 RepID=A0A1X0DBN0_9MYCO|nr:YbaB/EbfC family nucleoid-associated protein [Mycolicibacterium insubricum]MCB0930219.1 YbaB/EbfC family nucleoid-associated protein [Mycobacterium sp.]MCV7081224.1 YbaB/EbfC family nucleoid-associated protein [Mycolicibacterium insubricum]ORA69816.1 DNA-binding protein [Mycolicibacterium insubricum]BBZ67189.1 hypothetical protein MINS_26180 [Mycolicibacterium insubricum]
MDNDELRHEVDQLLATAQEQIADLAKIQEKQAAMSTTASAADGMVKVTVDAHGNLVSTEIDEDYLDDFEFTELAEHVTEAAREATREAATKLAELFAPLNERSTSAMSSAPGIADIPDFTAMIGQLFELAKPETGVGAPNDVADDDPFNFPKVRG